MEHETGETGREGERVLTRTLEVDSLLVPNCPALSLHRIPLSLLLMASMSFSPRKPTHPTGQVPRIPTSQSTLWKSLEKKWHWPGGILGTIALLSMQLDESSEKPEAADIPNRQRLQSQLL